MTEQQAAMPEYVLTGRGPRGRTVTEIVEANSADEAVRTFEGLGFTEIVLHTDDNVARFISPSKVRNIFSPRDFIGYRTRSRIGCMLFLARKLYQKSWHLGLLCLGFIWMQWQFGIGWTVTDVLLLAVVLWPIVFAVYAELTTPVAAYKRVLNAIVWAQWDRVPRLMKRVRRLELPPFERPLREAQAMAGQGRLDEALDRFAALADDPRIPVHMYFGFRGAICTAARERAKALESFARAAELAPDNAPVQIEYAVTLLTLKRDTRRARDRLDLAAKHALSDAGTPARLFAEGVLAYEQGNAIDAADKLAEAIRRLRPYSRANPSVLIALARIRAYLALAQLTLGDATAARREWRSAEPILARHDPPEFARCRDLLG